MITIPLDAQGSYVNWSVIHISITNLTIIIVMIVLFILALVVPFPDHDDAPRDES